MAFSGLAFQKICDWSFDSRYPVTFNYDKVKDGDRVFLNLDYFIDFVKEITHENNEKKKFILFTHNSDKTFTNEHYNKIKDFVYRVYAINNICTNKNVFTIPIAFQDHPKNHFNLIVGLFLKHKLFEKTNLVYMNFNIDTNPSKRTECFNYFNSLNWVTKKSNISKQEFMKDVVHSKYVISPEGTGIDCHRIYEAIACGSIPIVKKSNTVMDDFYTKLPVLLVDEWTDVSEDFLTRDYQIYKISLDLWLETNKGWMTAEHWIQKLHFVSFGDDKYARTKMRLKKQATDSNFFSSINIYSPKDFGEDFPHMEFIQNNQRGFGYWIWKLYFILKKMEQIQKDDVVVYTDAGSSVNKCGKKRLHEYLQLIKDENDILCFQMHHFPEYKYTKNDVFEFFNLSEHERTTGQIHATVILIRKTERSHAFLKKMYNHISTNTNLITDTPSVSPNRVGFIDHRHDQSVFSVMMKAEYTNKAIVTEETWPADGKDWKTINHVPILATRLRY